MLIRGLPQDSLTIRTLHPQWSNTEELLSLLAELVDYGNRLYFQAHSKKGVSQPAPLRIPRPIEEAKPKPKALPVSSSEVKDFFAGAVEYTPGG